MASTATMVAVIGFQFIPEISPRLHFQHYHDEDCGRLRIRVLQKQNRFCFILKPCLAGYFFE